VFWPHCQENAGLYRVLGSVAIQLYVGECTPSVDPGLRVALQHFSNYFA